MKLKRSSYRSFLYLGLLGLPLQALAAEPVTFDAPVESFTDADPVAVDVVNFDRDGYPDAVTANRQPESTSKLFNDGFGSFNSREDQYIPDGCLANAVAARDFNRDGVPDIATVCDDQIFVTFTDAPPLLPFTRYGRNLHGAATSDFDEDGVPDLVYLSDSPMAAHVERFTSGEVIQQTTVRLTSTPLDVAAAGDITRDGHADFVVLGADATVTLVSGKGPNGAFYPRKPFPTRAGATRIALGEATGDTHPDILVAGPGFVSVLTSDGNGEFGRTPAITSTTDDNSPVTAFVTADFNNDGRTDVVLASDTGLGFWIYLNQGNGTFGQGAYYLSASPISALAVGDFDNDGKVDLLTVERERDAVSVYLNTTGTGTVGKKLRAPRAARPKVIPGKPTRN
jgi:hypothetical protein